MFAHKCKKCGYEEIAIYGNPLGHDWGDVVYEWSKDNSKVTATRICKNDKTHIETETVDTTSKVLKAATCSETGLMGYYATFDNKELGSVSKEDVVIPKIDHDWDPVIDYEWTADNWKVTATRKCKSNSAHNETETVDTTYEIIKYATQSEKGQKLYTAKFTNSALGEITKTVEYEYEQVETPNIKPFAPDTYYYNKTETAAPLSVVASVNDGGTLTYQWYYYQETSAGDSGTGPDDNDTSKFTKIEGATSASYTPVTNVTLNLAHGHMAVLYYYVEVTNNKNGNTATVKSNVITVVIDTNVSITFDANGGTVTDDGIIHVDKKTIRVEPDIVMTTVPHPSYEGYEYMGWSTDKNAISGFKAEDHPIAPNTNTIYYAIWKQKENNE